MSNSLILSAYHIETRGRKFPESCPGLINVKPNPNSRPTLAAQDPILPTFVQLLRRFLARAHPRGREKSVPMTIRGHGPGEWSSNHGPGDERRRPFRAWVPEPRTCPTDFALRSDSSFSRRPMAQGISSEWNRSWAVRPDFFSAQWEARAIPESLSASRRNTCRESACKSYRPNQCRPD